MAAERTIRGMGRLGAIAVIAGALGGAAALSCAVPLWAAQSDPPAQDATVPPRKRVCVIIDPNRWVAGTVVKEDDFTMVVLADGREVEVTKTRVMHIVPLIDLPAPQPGVISFRDGRTLRATIVSDDFNGVTYEVAGIRNTLAREHVLSVRLLPTIEEQLKTMKATLAPSDLQRHLQICRWLLQEGRADLAELELEPLVEANPNDETARDLLGTVRLVLRSATGAGAAESPTSVEPNNPYLGRVISPEEANLIRLFEVDLADPPRVRIDPATVQEFLAQYGHSKLIPAESSDRARLAEGDSLEVLRLMFALKAREFYPRVQVVTEPTALRLFSRTVYNRWIIPNCATSRCHGGTDAGDFFLHGSNPHDDEVRMTNLLILLRKQIDDTPIINFGSPRDSLLIQYALPRHLARTPHPAVRGWTPALARAPERMANEAEAWIRSMYQPRPDYMVDYEPPARPKIDPTDPAQNGER